MYIIHLINNTYQVVTEDNTKVYFRGSKEECEKFKQQETETYPCPQCQGGGCPYCSGYGTIPK